MKQDTLGKIILNTLSAKDAKHEAFITNYHVKCQDVLNRMGPEARKMIQSNKDLNDMYDIFLDFILDTRIIVE